MTASEIKLSASLAAIFAFRMLGLFMILPAFSFYAAHLPHATPTLIGLALGVYGLTQGLFQLPFGIWSDFISRKKVIFLGLTIFVLGSAVCALSHTLIGIILGRALQGAGAIGSTTIALLGDLTSPENRTKAMAIIGISIAFSFMLAMVFGPSFAHWMGISGIFWFSAASGIVALYLLFKIPSPAHHAREFNLKQLPAQFKVIFSNPILCRLNLSILISHMILMALFVVIPKLLITEYQFSLAQQWKLYLPVLALVIFLIGGLMRRKNFVQKEYHYLLLCILSMLVAELLFACTALPSFPLLYLSFFLFFFGFTFLEALLPSLVSKNVSSEYRGTASGIFSSCQFLGIFLGGLWGGYLSQKSQFFGVFLGNTLLALLWLLVMLPLLSKSFMRSVFKN